MDGHRARVRRRCGSSSWPTIPAGEFAGKLLADLGADVVKVEPPGGFAGTARRAVRRRPGRRPGRQPDFWTTTRASAASCSTTRRSRAAPLRDELIAGADVLHHHAARPPRAARGSGLDVARSGRARPGLIILSVTPFGLTGPWADCTQSDLVALAAGGPLNSCGYDDHSIPPIRPGGNQGYTVGRQLRALLACCSRCSSGSAPDAASWSTSRCTRPRGERRARQPVLVLPEGARAAADLPPCAAGADPAGALPVRRRPLGLLRADPGRPEGSGTSWSTGWTAKGLAADLAEQKYTDAAYRQPEFAHIQDLVEVFFLMQDGRRAYHEASARPADRPADRARGPVRRRAPDGARLLRLRRARRRAGRRLYPGPPFRFSATDAAPMTPGTTAGRAHRRGPGPGHVGGTTARSSTDAPKRSITATGAPSPASARPTSRRDSGRSDLTLATQAALAAIADAGWRAADIDGIVRCDMDIVRHNDLVRRPRHAPT